MRQDTEGLMEVRTAAAAVVDSFYLRLGAFPTVQGSLRAASRTGVVVALVVQYSPTISH